MTLPDAKLRYVRSLQRKSYRTREGRMLVEGVRLVADALDAGAEPDFALTSPALDATQAGRRLHMALTAAAAPVFEVTSERMAELADTVSPQGVLAVLPAPSLPWPTDADLVVVLDGLQDPGNVGTALRTAAAAGADGVLLAPGTVELTNPKVVRAAMGAHFRLPIAHAGWDEIGARLDRLAVWVADTDGTHAHTDVDWGAPSALVIGSEAHGPSDAARALARGTVRIAMAGPIDSLNVAAALAVLLFEAARQRRDADGRPAGG